MSKRKLLLADDSITIQKVVNLTFADEGIEVISVGDGNSAMDKIREESPDLIMADVNMPGLNGYEICEKVRQSDEYKRTPVILLVGSFEPFDEAEAKRVGADDFLKKPFQSINQLVNTVTVLLDSESAASYGDPVDDVSSESIESDDDDDDDEFYGMNTATQEYADPKIDDEMIETSQNLPENDPGFPTQEVTDEFRQERSYEEVQEEDIADEDFKEFSIVGPSDTPEVSTEDVTDDEVGSGESAFSSDAEESYDTDMSGYDSSDEPVSTEESAEVTEDQTEEVELHLDPANLLELTFDEHTQPSSNDSYVESNDEEFGASLLTTEIDEPELVEPEVDEHEADETDETAVDVSGKENDIEEYVAPQEEEFSEEINSAEFVEGQEPEGTVEQADESGYNDNGDSLESSQISPEMIEEISRRVIEHLSGDALKDVAREVVPEMAERIIRQIAEEKMND